MEFKIDEFSGPLDLLLHLIKESKMDIMNIEIEEITKQYMDYLALQEKMNLEVASEYLVLASELLVIKSRLLLPREKIEEDEEVEEDPRERLVNRLLEYQAYKEITKVLQEKELIRRDIYTKLPENMGEFVDKDNNKPISKDVTLDDLTEAFKKYLVRKEESKPLKTKVCTNEISVSSRCSDIKKLLIDKKKLSFSELFPVVSKDYIVATFLAILEMAKKRELVITQENNFDDILVEAIVV